METDMRRRRDFLAGILASGLAPKTGWSAVGCPIFLSAARHPDGRHCLLGLNASGRALFEIALPTRGHAAAAHPTRPEAVIFARRPGRFGLVLDCITGKQTKDLFAPQGRHFYGHGAFSIDGTRLFTTENDYAAGRGVIGVWATDHNFARLGEFASGGIGPHDILRLPGSDILVVANGGIETHPHSGREKLNLSTMRPNLTYLSTEGCVLEQVEMPKLLRMNSIRHLAARSDGLIAFAMQAQTRSGAMAGLLGFHQMGEPPRLSIYPPAALRTLRGYIGSVSFNANGRQLAVTSSRGGVAHFIDVEQQCYLHAAPIHDVSGIGANGSGFLATSGTGRLTFFVSSQIADSHKSIYQWDNHLIRIPVG